MVRVSTFDVTGRTPKIVQERVLNSNGAENRNWIIKQIGWATRSGYGVQVQAEPQDTKS